MKINQQNIFEDRKQAFKICEQTIKQHSKSFYAAFSQLPKKKAQSIYAIYTFCRVADDIVDEEKDAQKLQQLFQELELFEAGSVPNHPMWLALEAVFSEFPMDIRPFYDMLIGQRMDLNFQQPKTQQELLDYAYYVAGSVGLMLLPVLSPTPTKIITPAKKLGEAMQLKNILRDIGEDYRLGRIYLPKEDMLRYQITTTHLEKQIISDNFINLWEALAKKAEKLYNESLEMIPFIANDARHALLSALMIYKELLPEIRRNHYNIYEKKHVVSTRRKIELIHALKRNM
jgi:phytoene synthase